MYQTVDDRVVNEKGEVAVAYYQTIPHYLKVNGTNYGFDVKRNICMAWIKPSDVDIVLSQTKSCCGGQKRTVYRLEHEVHVRRFMENLER